ncbi:MAG: hypothetical protein JWR68_1336 [Polaromonas sp.]|nr:hypothetical protein [Polaromonas sp.]
MNFLSVPFACCALVLLSGAAAAQTAAPAGPAASPLSFNIALTSNYKFRGQDQDQSKTKVFKPALQGGVDYAFDSGFYLGNWNSTVNWTRYLPSNPSNHVEIDIYGGYKFNAGPLAMDVGALTYFYPGASGASTTEAYLGAGFGPLSAKYSHTVSKGYFGIGKEFLVGEGRGTGYLNLAFAQEVMPNVTLKASLGFTNLKSGANSAGLPDYLDYSVGASYDLGSGLALSGAFVGADKKPSYVYPAAVDTSGRSINKNTLVVMLTKTL